MNKRWKNSILIAADSGVLNVSFEMLKNNESTVFISTFNRAIAFEWILASDALHLKPLFWHWFFLFSLCCTREDLIECHRYLMYGNGNFNNAMKMRKWHDNNEIINSKIDMKLKWWWRRIFTINQTFQAVAAFDWK